MTVISFGVAFDELPPIFVMHAGADQR